MSATTVADRALPSRILISPKNSPVAGARLSADTSNPRASVHDQKRTHRRRRLQGQDGIRRDIEDPRDLGDALELSLAAALEKRDFLESLDLVFLLWQRLLGRPASESGTLRHGDGTHGRSDRCRRSFVLPILPGRTVTGCVILRNSHVIRVAARRVRLIREIPAYTRRSTGQWRLRASPARVARTRQDGNKEIDYS